MENALDSETVQSIHLLGMHLGYLLADPKLKLALHFPQINSSNSVGIIRNQKA